MASPYWIEEFTAGERERLAPYVTSVDLPVFALRNLPQVTAAALFARYSRSAKSLRRLLLDEFLGEGELSAGPADAGRAKASDLFGRVLAEYGDDSVAQLGGAHLACEQVSQPLAKLIERGRLAAYLEQSTRYIAYTDRRDGNYRWYRDLEVLASPHGAAFAGAMDGLFDTYSALIDPLRAHLEATLPAEADEKARRRAIRALALDLLRGLLPAGTVSNVGVFASPQAYEQMVMRLRAHPLPEARACAEMIRDQLIEVIPEFLTRLDRAERGGVWVDYRRETADALAAAAAELGSASSDTGDSVRLLRWDADAEQRILAAALYPYSDLDAESLEARVAELSEERRRALFADAVGARRNRRHKPGRGFEHADYTFEIVSDYGAFRDLQRHRLLTIDWQSLTPALGYEIPDAVGEAGLADRWRSASDRALQVHAELAADFPQQAQYLVTLAHRIRYQVKLNAREAIHLIELRSSPQGHPSYRRVAREMHRQIGEVAGHRLLAEAMRFVGTEDVHLPRYAAEAGRVAAGAD